MSICESPREWTDRATCSRRPHHWWDYPDRHPNTADVYRLHRAATICQRCPVQAECSQVAATCRPMGQVWAAVAYTNEGVPLPSCSRCGLPCILTRIADKSGRIWCSEYCQAHTTGRAGALAPYRIQFPVWTGAPRRICRMLAIGRLRTEIRRHGMLPVASGRWIARHPTVGEHHRWAPKPLAAILEYRTHAAPMLTQ